MSTSLHSTRTKRGNSTAATRGNSTTVTRGNSTAAKRGNSTAATRGTAEAFELVPKNDCLKVVKDFNRETARYCTMVVALGGANDSDNLRDEMKKSRRRACELAKQNQQWLLPHINNTLHSKEDATEYERLWTLFSSALEVLTDQVYKTLLLWSTFPLHQGKCVFINTGVVDPVISSHKSSCPISDSGDSQSSSKRTMEREDYRALEREFIDLRDMLLDMNQKVDVKPWTIEPDINISKFACSKSLHSLSDASSIVEVVSVYDSDRQRRRKCICLGLSIILAVAVFATVLGICIALLT